MLGTILMPRKNIHVHPLFDPLNLAPGIPGKPVLLVGRYFILFICTQNSCFKTCCLWNHTSSNEKITGIIILNIRKRSLSVYQDVSCESVQI